jgi:nucleoside phosphorylase
VLHAFQAKSPKGVKMAQVDLSMKFRSAAEILQDANARGLRRALIVTALPIEMKAVRAHLRDLGSCAGRDGTIYECGQFTGQGDEWLAVVAESGVGTHPAQSVVTYAHAMFGAFEVLLFMGVGASRKPEAPVGSVVASNYVYFPYSGKYGPSGFTSRPRSLPVDARLVGLARKVQRDENWPERICAPLKGQLPAQGDYPQPFPPAAFVAPIVSIEAVSADPESELERQITSFYGDAHALEMEGYGAVFAANLERTPSIIIRGISDMRGGKVSELDAIHQPVAAVHAAAFGFELLDAWGQSYRPEPRAPAPPSPAPQPPEPTLEPRAGDDGGPAPRSTLVLNFEGSAEDFPPEKIDKLVEALRQATGNSKIRVVGSEPGSFRLLIEAVPGDLAKINSDDVRQALSNDHGIELLGALEEPEYRATQDLHDRLQLASRPLLDWPQNLPDGTLIERPELDQLLRIVDEAEGSTTALLGLPGSGKSALLAAFGGLMDERGTPLLAIKADLLEPSIQTEANLRDHLDLPGTPSELLSQIARLQPVVLLIDQLDALSGYVDLRTGRLSVLLNLVRKLGTTRNVHIVISARTFEYEHDVRLKAVKAESLTLELPPWSTVLQLLEAQGVQAAGWPTDAQEVMRSPQALATFLKLRDRAGTPPFRTYQAMLDQLWRERVLQRSDGPRLSQLASTIAERMAEKETLWLATARFDDQAADLDALIASGILTRYGVGGGSVGFSHQTVFEHALARAFVQQEGRLSTYVLERESSLFVRPKLWAALTYLREVEPSTYESELQAIWSAQNLRLHLRHLLIEFLGQQATPSDTEALLMEWALRSPDRKVALQGIAGSPGWFARFASSYIGPAMLDRHTTANLAAAILERAWTFAPEQVASLIRARWISDTAFDGLVWAVLQECPNWSEDVVKLATTVLGRTNISPFAFDHTVATVGVDQPEAALKLVRARLDREFAAAAAEAERRVALPKPAGEEAQLTWLISKSPSEPLKNLLERGEGWDSLEALAQANSGPFLEAVWPWFQRVFEALRDIEEDREGRLGFPLPYAGDFRFEGEHSLGLPEGPLLGALRVAAESYAAGDEDGFLAWLASNEHEAATPAQRLFAHTLASIPERYASRALKFLLDDPNRLHIGSTEDLSGTAKRIVKSVSPFWRDEELRVFERAVLTYAPSPRPGLTPKDRQHFHSYMRKLKLELLCALPANRVSSEVRRHTTEERRRFPDDRSGATFSGVSFIGSPIAAKSLGRASDDDILNAFRTLPDATGWNHPRSWRIGGNIQLSREFANFAKENPTRAAKLIKKLEPSFGTRASGYALDAMAETADPKLILELIQTLHERGFDSEEFRGSVARAIERLVRRDVRIEEATVAILEGWLAAAPPVEMDEEADGAHAAREQAVEPTENDRSGGSTQTDHAEGSILWNSGGISVLPHGNFPVLEALTRVLLARAEHDRLLTLLREHLGRAESLNVWQSLLQFLVYLRPTSPDDLIAFLVTLFGRYPNLSKTREAAYLLAHAQWTIPEFVHSILLAWRTSEEPWVQQAFGELVALIAVVQPRLDWAGALLKAVVEINDFSRARIGAAYSAVNLWNESDKRTAASDLLKALVPRADKRAWSAIFDLFRLVDQVTPDRDWTSLLEIMADHIQEAEGLSSSFVIERLQTLLPHQALLVARIAKGLVANWRDELGDVRTGTAAIGPELVDLAITLHRLGPLTRDIGTSLFEDLLEINAYSARQTLAEIDNRFDEVRRPARRRLPRRSAQHARRSVRRSQE